MITVNGGNPLTIITKRFILDVAAVLGPPLGVHFCNKYKSFLVDTDFSSFVYTPVQISIMPKTRD